MKTDQEPLSAPDNANVVAPAPVFFIAAIAIGFALEYLFATSLLAFAYSTAIGAVNFVIVMGITLVLQKVWKLGALHVLLFGSVRQARAAVPQLLGPVVRGRAQVARGPARRLLLGRQRYG